MTRIKLMLVISLLLFQGFDVLFQAGELNSHRYVYRHYCGLPSFWDCVLSNIFKLVFAGPNEPPGYDKWSGFAASKHPKLDNQCFRRE